MSLVYDQDILIVWNNQYYHLPTDVWQKLPAKPISDNDRVELLVANGAAVAAIPNLPEDVTGKVGATCYLLNLDALKGGE